MVTLSTFYCDIKIKLNETQTCRKVYVQLENLKENFKGQIYKTG